MKENAPATNAVMVMTEGITPFHKNMKLHPEEQIVKLAFQIQEHGFDQPIVVDKDMVIIKGHGRWLAAKYLKLKKVPVVVRDDLKPSSPASMKKRPKN